MNFNEILYGVAYYDEYMPYDRIETDFKMIRDAGMNVIRIAAVSYTHLDVYKRQLISCNIINNTLFSHYYKQI